MPASSSTPRTASTVMLSESWPSRKRPCTVLCTAAMATSRYGWPLIGPSSPRSRPSRGGLHVHGAGVDPHARRRVLHDLHAAHLGGVPGDGDGLEGQVQRQHVVDDDVLHLL